MHLLLAIACSLLVSINALPTGAPAGACTSQMPSHGATAQDRMSPYNVTVNAATYTYGIPVIVNVTGNADNMVRGVFCQMRTADGSSWTGTFAVPDGVTKIKTTQCEEADDSLTHADRTDVMYVSFMWYPPMEDMGNVKVMCTVVKDVSTFWISQVSSQLSYLAADAEGEPEGEGEGEPEGEGEGEPEGEGEGEPEGEGEGEPEGEGEGEPEWGDDDHDDDAPMPDYNAASSLVASGIVGFFLSVFSALVI